MAKAQGSELVKPFLCAALKLLSSTATKITVLFIDTNTTCHVVEADGSPYMYTLGCGTFNL